MPTVVNRNSHRVSSGGYKLSAGQVKEVSGEEADALTGISGVEEASQDEQDAYAGRSARSQGMGQLGAVTKLAAEAKIAHRTLLVSIPLQTVIGDDAAPHGPNTGTITTKQALAKEDPELRRHFAPNERLAGEEDNENLNDVERQQAANLTTLEELQAEVEQQQQDEGYDEEQPAEEQPTQEQAVQAPGSPAAGGTKRRGRKQDESSEE